MADPAVSLIVATYNEADLILPLLEHLRSLHDGELIVADGSSTDGTADRALPYASVIRTVASRAVQFNEAARRARGDLLLFLHADVRLGGGALPRMAEAMRDRRVLGGNFDIQYQGGDVAASAFTRINRWRRRFGVFYGDSGIFARRSFFESTGGYRDWPILEDYEFARRLWRTRAVALLDEPIYVSDRRWKRAGLIRTMWHWFWIQGLYLAGVSPFRLAGMYRAVR